MSEDEEGTLLMVVRSLNSSSQACVVISVTRLVSSSVLDCIITSHGGGFLAVSKERHGGCGDSDIKT